jgi:hypothetical protein
MPQHTLKARLLCVATGEIREYTMIDEYETEADWQGMNHSYQWGPDGNYGCDCNRELFFLRANDEPEPDGDGRCGESRYRLLGLFADGDLVYRDEENDR